MKGLRLGSRRCLPPQWVVTNIYLKFPGVRLQRWRRNSSQAAKMLVLQWSSASRGAVLRHQLRVQQLLTGLRNEGCSSFGCER